MNICLCDMTLPLCRQFYKNFANDPDTFMDIEQYFAYFYDESNVDAYWVRQKEQNRIHLAIMLNDTVIGEILLKNIDMNVRSCTLSIHMQNDSVKNKGYGTKAEILALEYAFHKLNMNCVFADAVLKNRRSQHVLSKVGFTKTHSDGRFIYYKCEKAGWRAPKL